MQCWSADRVGLVEWWPPTRASVWYAGQQPKWLTRADQAVSVQVVPKHVHWVRNGRQCCASIHPALQVMESRAVLILDSLVGEDVSSCPCCSSCPCISASTNCTGLVECWDQYIAQLVAGCVWALYLVVERSLRDLLALNCLSQLCSICVSACRVTRNTRALTR